jgi:Protein of unknown function (DUF3052)
MARARPILRLVCADVEAAAGRVRLLEKAGYKVHAGPSPTKQIGGHFRDLAPAVIVIDMDRLPSHGRNVAVVLRTTKSTRHFPIVFAGGEPEKVARARTEMPDACFTDWKNAASAIAKFLQNPPANPIEPPGYMDQFAGSSTIKKLGFKSGMKIAMLGEPEGFVEQLGELPEGVEIAGRIDRKMQLVLWFVRSRGELESEVAFMAASLPDGCSIWIVHPKQTSRIRADFNQNDVRNAALLVGLVDYKVCSVDADWSGLKFARKKI